MQSKRQHLTPTLELAKNKKPKSEQQLLTKFRRQKMRWLLVRMRPQIFEHFSTSPKRWEGAAKKYRTVLRQLTTNSEWTVKGSRLGFGSRFPTNQRDSSRYTELSQLGHDQLSHEKLVVELTKPRLQWQIKLGMKPAEVACFDASKKPWGIFGPWCLIL